MDLKMAVSEKGGGLEEKRMEDFLDRMRRDGRNRLRVLCDCMGNGGYDRYAE